MKKKTSQHDLRYKTLVYLFQPTTTNDLGTLNNVVKVKKSDFEVFEALDIDSKSAASSKKHGK